jgi:hypothetical protein
LRSAVDGGVVPALDIALQPLEVGAELGAMLVPQPSILFEQLEHDLLQSLRNRAVQRARRHGRAIEHGIDGHGRRLPRKGPLSRQQLVQHETEGEEVRTAVERFAPELLRSHICQRADRDALARPGSFESPGFGARR